MNKLLLLLALACLTRVPCAEPVEKISGALVIHGGGNLGAEVLDAFVKLAGGAEARIVVIPTAAGGADNADSEKEVAGFKSRQIASATMLHTRSREKADSAEFVEPLTKATGVWLGGGLQAKLEDAYVGTAVQRELLALLKRGGVVGGTSAGAAAMSEVMIRQGNPVAEVGRGLGLLPGAVVDQHFLKRNRAPRLAALLAQRPGLFGLGVDEGTAVIVRGRQMAVLGESTATVWLSAGAGRPARSYGVKAGQQMDLIALSRAAVARAGAAFPPAEAPAAEVAGKGTLIIVGGGIPPEALTRFIECAGGPDAPIAVVPTALGEDPPKREPAEIVLLRKAGARNLSLVHARNRAEAEEAKVLDALRQAKGIWFCGGRQWRLVDSFLDTPAEKLMHEMVARGGVIGGSSAGATIQADYLVRGNPLGNLEMMSEGYERGLGFLKGVAIDQHFAQRNRFADMSALKKAFPQLLGLGIDENAALIVRGHEMEIVGTNNVQVYDNPPLQMLPGEQEKGTGAEKDYTLLKPGERYDLKTRKKIEK